MSDRNDKIKIQHPLRHVVFLAVVFLLVRYDLFGRTLANMRDQEKSQNNTFTAAELALSAHFSETTSLKAMAANLDQPDVLYKKDIKIKYDGDAKIDYDIQADNFSGDLCDKLNLKADQQGSDANDFNGELKKFKKTVENFSGEDQWKLAVGLKDGASDWQGQKCEFDIIITGRQNKYAIKNLKGFSDEEKLHNTIETPAADNNSPSDGSQPANVPATDSQLDPGTAAPATEAAVPADADNSAASGGEAGGSSSDSAQNNGVLSP